MENNLNISTLTSSSSNRIKLLLSLKNFTQQNNESSKENIFDEKYEQYNDEDEKADEQEKETNLYSNYIEEITDEEFNTNVREMDALIMDIMRTKHKLKLNKLKSKIRTKEDLLDFLNIKDNNDNKLPPEPSSNNSSEYLNKLKINPKNKSNTDYDKIKEKLFSQNKIISSEKDKIKKIEKIENNDSTFMTKINSTTNDNSIYDEIRKAELRCDDLLDDIDECIKMGEDIDKIIDINK